MAGQMWDMAATPIGKAVVAGDVNELNQLVKNGENILFKDRKQNTYYHFISTMYRPSVFYALAALGIDIQAQNRHGNTALHVTALQREAGHVGDLMSCGIDPFIKNKDGKIAEELKTQNKYWHMIYDRYKPGIFHAVKQHDIPGIRRLLHCWCRVDTCYNKQTLRQYAALLKFHDIVVIIDQHMATNNMIYGVFEGNHEKVKDALKKTRCQVNFLNEISAKKHILQFAIKFQDFRFVKMLCDAGADVNTPVRVNNYFWGPLYFEAIHKSTPLEILRYVLKSGADFTLKDERGRTGFMYALDNWNGYIPLDIFQYMLNNGSDVTERDITGCNPRDIARFTGRYDVVEIIDKTYVKTVRASDCVKLRAMARDGYDSLIITYNYRDTFIYAAGNQTDDALRFVYWIPKFQEARRRLHIAVEMGHMNEVNNVLSTCLFPEIVINARNKARRTPLILAVLHEQEDVVDLLLSLPYGVDVNAKDCCNRTAYHFASCLATEIGQSICSMLIDAGADTDICDVRGWTGNQLVEKIDPEQFIAKEQKAVYGMIIELDCVDKYEALKKIIRSKKKGLPEFLDKIRQYKFPVASLSKVLSPLMQNYRDLLFLAIDYGKQDIAYRLANLGADLRRREKYEHKEEDGTVTQTLYTAAERAAHLGFQELSVFLDGRLARQLHKSRIRSALLPQRGVDVDKPNLNRDLGKRSRSMVFVTQSVA